MNRHYAADRPEDSRLEARIESYELAARMQVAAPEAFDLTAEPQDRTTSTAPAARSRRRLRPQLPARPPAAGTRRALRAGLERPRRPDEQLGQPRRTSPRNCRPPPGRSISRSPPCSAT